MVISGQNSDLTAKIRQSEKDLCGLGESAEEMSESFSKADKRIADILANTERTCGSKAASIAAILRQQGMSQSESFTEAWSMIERNVSDKTDNISRKVSSGTEDVKRSIKRSNEDIEKSVKEVGESAEQTSENVLGAFQKIASGIAALGLGKLIKDSITEAMDAVESDSLFETSLGGYSDKAREWSDELSDSLGLNAVELRKNAGILYTMTSSMGLTEEQAYSLSTSITELSQDMASFYNIDSEEAFTKLRSGLTGETEPLKALGILVDESTVKQYAYKYGIAETGAELTNQQKVLGRYIAVMSQTSTAQGDLARTIDSPANQYRLLQNEIQKAKLEIGTAFLPFVQTALPMLSAGVQAVTPIMTKLADGAAQAAAWYNSLNPISQTFLKVCLMSAAAIPAVTLAVKGLAVAKTGLHAVQALLIPQTITLGTVMKSAFGWIALAAGAIALLASFGDTGISDINTDAEQAADGLSSLYDGLDDTQSIADTAAESIDVTADAMDELTEAAGSLAGFDEINILDRDSGSIMSQLINADDIANLDAFASGLTNISGDISDVQNKAAKGATLKVGVFSDEFVSKLETAESAVRSLFGERWTDFWEDVGGAVYDAFEDHDPLPLLETLDGGIRLIFGDGWSEFWQDVGEGMYEGIENGDWYPLLEAAEGGVEKLFGSGWTKFWEDIGSNWTDFWEKRGEDLYDGVHGAWNKIKKGFTGWNSYWETKGEKLYDFLAPKITEVKDWFLERWDDLKVGYKTWGRFWEEKGEELYDGVWWAIEGLQSGLNSLKQGISDISDVYNSSDGWWGFWEGFGGYLAGDAYADGGFPDYGEVFIAREAGPEMVGTIGGKTAVANNSQITEAIAQAVEGAVYKAILAGNSGRSQKIELTSNLYLDGKLMTDKVIERINDKTKLNGKSPLNI